MAHIQDAAFLLHSAHSSIQTGLCKGLIAGKMKFATVHSTYTSLPNSTFYK